MLCDQMGNLGRVNALLTAATLMQPYAGRSCAVSAFNGSAVDAEGSESAKIV
jgi:hypothetical protein